MSRLVRLALMALVASVAALAPSSVAASRRAPVPHGPISIQAVFDRDGNPSLVANFVVVPTWSICPPGAACQTVHTPHAILDSGPEPAGTVFTASAMYRGQTNRASVTWQGQVQATAPPQLVGAPRFGAHIKAAAGTWTGGWGNESDQLGLEACQTPDGGGCFVLSGGQYGCPTRSSATIVGDALTGLYLFALDLRLARDALCAGVGWSFPAAIPAWPREQIVARSTAVGPVVGPPAPKVAILRHARLRGGHVLVASVHCARRCRVWLYVAGRRNASWGSQRVTGTRIVGVPRRRLRSGTVSVAIHVDDGPVVSGRCRLRSNG